jgi:hypothetical protein
MIQALSGLFAIPKTPVRDVTLHCARFTLLRNVIHDFRATISETNVIGLPKLVHPDIRINKAFIPGRQDHGGT